MNCLLSSLTLSLVFNSSFTQSKTQLLYLAQGEGNPNGKAFYQGHTLLKDELDIMIPTIRNLEYLGDMEAVLQDVSPSQSPLSEPLKTIKVPKGLIMSITTTTTLIRFWVPSLLAFPSRTTSLWLGFLISKKKYIFTINNDCFVCSLSPFDFFFLVQPLFGGQ